MKIIKVKDWLYRFNPKFQNSWDASGYKNNVNFWGTQTDWNQTLVTKMNEISAQIHMSTLLGGADTAETHSSNMNFIRCFEYYNELTKKIGNRFDVIINDLIDKDLVLVYKNNNIPLSFPEGKIKMTMGIVKIKNKLWDIY
jgi:hypothetical protein